MNRINGSQLAKMKKSIPHMSLPWIFQLYLKNNNFCEYVKFGAISLKSKIL